MPAVCIKNYQKHANGSKISIHRLSCFNCNAFRRYQLMVYICMPDVFKQQFRNKYAYLIVTALFPAMVEITEISSSVTKQTNCLVHLLFSSHDGNSVFFHKLRGGPEKNLSESNLFISLPWDAVKTLSQIFLLYNLVCSPSFSSHNSEELYKNTQASFLKIISFH